jgi:hypothetical protein
MPPLLLLVIDDAAGGVCVTRVGIYCRFTRPLVDGISFLSVLAEEALGMNIEERGFSRWRW